MSDNLAAAKKKKERRKIPLGWLLSVSLLVGIGWVVPVREVWQALLRANPVLLALATGPVVFNLWLRGIRWALLFRPSYEISSRAAVGPVWIGLGLNAVLPGRAGEIARVAFGARKLGVPVPFVLSTVVGERLLDAVTLLAFLGGSLLLLPPVESPAKIEFMGYSLSPERLYEVASRVGIGSALLVGMILSLLIPSSQRLLSDMCGQLPLVGSRVRTVLDELGRGLTALQRPLILVQVLSLSLLLWFALGLTILLASEAVPGVDLSLWQALILMSISVAVSALPSAPGAWGVYEAGILLALALSHVYPEEDAGIAFAFAAHICQYLPVVALGGIAGLQSKFGQSRSTGGSA